jgi:DNA-binding winged helix-turn-helix (wHTH) protein
MKWMFLNLKGSPIMIYISSLVSRRCRTSSRFAAALISSSVLLFGASLALSGCASSKEEQRYSWPLATASPEDTVTQLFAEKFAEEVHDLSNGAMRIQVYANSTLGGDRDLLETCADGDIPFVVQNTAPQVSFMKDLAVFDLPCVFDSLDDCRKKLDDPDFYNLISQVYTDGGYHLLGMADQGFRIMSTNKPVYSLADFKGQKIRTMENSKVTALDMGADDYLTKPFGTGELLARIRTALRHAQRSHTHTSHLYEVGDLSIDFERRLVKVKGQEVHLTQIEYKLVCLLAQNAGRVMTYESIITKIWGPYADNDNQILRVNMAHIRRKLEENPAEPQYIFTEIGVGYRMREE